MSNLSRIGIDVMSGDLPPAELIKGCVDAVNEYTDTVVVAVGQEALIQKELEGHRFDEERLHVLPASEVVGMNEAPASACRQKKDASVMVGCRALREGLLDAFMSPGNTGATLTAALLEVGRLRGVKRPALTLIINTPKGRFMVLDVGANADCLPFYIKQFAIMGHTYMKHVVGIADPRVGVLNIGEEEGKGNDLAQAAFHEVKKLPFQFMGNVEPHHAFEMKADVVVCDGFSGNLVLKGAEGMARMIRTIIKTEVKESLLSQVGALMLQNVFAKMKEMTDPHKYGALPLLGIAKPVYVGHGSSNALAIVSSVGACRMGLNARVTHHLTEAINHLS